MSYVPNLLAFGGTWAVIVISPGPDLLVTMRLAMTRSRREAMSAVFGIAVGTSVWATAAALGLAVILAQTPWITQVIRWCGAAYLLYLAIHALRSARAPLTEEVPDDPGAHDAPGTGLAAAWRTGLFADLGNPKAAIFWCSLFATTLPGGTPGWVLTIAVSVAVAIAAGWYTAAALLVSVAPVLRGYRRGRRWIDLLTGAILTAIAVRLIAGS